MLCVRCLAAGDITETQLSVSPSLPRAGPWSHTGKPPALIGRDLEGYAKSGRLGLYTHSEQHVCSCSAHRESAREKLYLLKLLEALAGLTALTERLGFWGGAALGELPQGSVLQCGGHTETWKRSWRGTRQGACAHTHRQQLYQQRNQSESVVWSHWVQLHPERTESVMLKGLWDLTQHIRWTVGCIEQRFRAWVSC